MSKAPGALEDYLGDGDWFKIGTSGASDGQNWDSAYKPEVLFSAHLPLPFHHPSLYITYLPPFLR